MTSTTPDHWNELVTGALLGTDRRDPPAPPDGPLADVVAEQCGRVTVGPHARVGGGVRRRCGGRRCDRWRRPTHWRHQSRTIAGWSGRRPLGAGERSSPSGRSSRTSGWPRSSAVASGCRRTCWSTCSGGTAVTPPAAPGSSTWAVRWPRGSSSCSRISLLPTAERRRRRLDGVPPLPVPPTLQALLTSPGDDVIPVIVAALRDGTFAAAHRAVLVNFVARMRPDALNRWPRLCGPPRPTPAPPG